MKTSFRTVGEFGFVKSSRGLLSRKPSFGSSPSRTVPADGLVIQKHRISGRQDSFQIGPRAGQVFWRRQCSADGSTDSNSWEQDPADIAPLAGLEDHDQLHAEWKALQQRLGSHYAASCQPELHEPYRFSVEESMDMDDVPAPWAPLLPFPAASPPVAASPPAAPLHHAPQCSCDREGREVWSVPQGRRDFLDGHLMWNDLSQVYVILYDGGGSTPEGIYSWRMTQPDGLPQDTIIAFESMADAQRYAAKLEGRTQPVGVAKPMVPRELLQFCVMSGYNCRLEPQGSLLSPCEQDVPLSDWEQGLSHGEGELDVNQPHDLCGDGSCSINHSWNDGSQDGHSTAEEASYSDSSRAEDSNAAGTDWNEPFGEAVWNIGNENILPRDPCADEFCSPDLTLNEARARLERLLAHESDDRF